MNTDNELKDIVKEKYGEIAKSTNSCCCGSSKIVDYTIMKDNYENLEGYVKEADLGLGCGLPTEFANISKGDIVVDLGSGAGNDVFIARSIVGENGLVIGIDMTEDMIDLAEKNKVKLGFTNIEFKLGEIESLPLTDNLADVVVSGGDGLNNNLDLENRLISPDIDIIFKELSANEIFTLYVRSISLHVFSREVLSQIILLFNHPG